MIIYTEQVNRNTIGPALPARIVSLVPSQTELLYSLGLDKEVVGITAFCVRPQHWLSTKTRIGGTKSVHINRINTLKPDLIIASKEENIKEQVNELASLYPVWLTDISNLQQALQMIGAAGSVTGTLTRAQAMIEQIKIRFDQLPLPQTGIRTAYLIWQNPYMTVGGDTFIHDMLGHAGFENIFKDQQRYPATTIEEIRQRHCELLLLSSEPFPFKQKHLQELQKQFPSTKILLADGEMFSWYGSRLLMAPDYFRSLMLLASA